MALTQEDRSSIAQLVSERLDATEERLLTAFYNWATPTDIRLRSAENNIASLKERLSLVEERVRDLESGRKRPQ